MSFTLHPRLQSDSIKIGRFTLSQLLLINDSQYPWCVLVPERIDITEIYQLSGQEQIQLQLESSILAKTLAETFNADKMNIAAIGNMVPQLHVHHIVRYKSDIAWPAPIWGKFETIPYTEPQLQKIKSTLLDVFEGYLV